jgi:dUTP pyrophosphatase
MKIRTKRFDKKFPLPKYEKMAAGFDFYCRESASLKPGEMKAVPANVAMEIPDGYVLVIVPRSSTAHRRGLMMPHSIGIVDPFYRGDDEEIVLLFYNFTKKKVTIKKGDRIAQGILLKNEKVIFQEVAKLKKSKIGKWKEKMKKKIG